MIEEIIKHIVYKEICDIISNTNKMLLLCLPNIDTEIAHAITEFKIKKNINDVKIIIDNSESNFRNGFGEIEAIEKLKKIGVNIFELKGNMVSFIISDSTGYFLFPQSKIFASEDDLKSNAFRINPIDLINLRNYFFPPMTIEEKQECQNEIIEKVREMKENIKDSYEEINQEVKKEFVPQILNEEQFKTVKKNLELNPPEHPDLKRKLNAYISKIQFVELEFKGSHFDSTNIKIPSRALPYKDENLKNKLMTKMRLFGDIKSKDKFEVYGKFENEFKELREYYLKPITCRKDKSIIEMIKKKDFVKKMDDMKNRISKVNDSLSELLEEEIIESRNTIKKELQIFLKENIPEHLRSYKEPLLSSSIEEEVNKIIYSIKIPKPIEILNKLEIEYRFYDLTIEDFKDEKLLNEFSKKGILGLDESSIIEFKKGFAIKR